MISLLLLFWGSFAKGTFFITIRVCWSLKCPLEYESERGMAFDSFSLMMSSSRSFDTLCFFFFLKSLFSSSFSKSSSSSSSLLKFFLDFFGENDDCLVIFFPVKDFWNCLRDPRELFEERPPVMRLMLEMFEEPNSLLEFLSRMIEWRTFICSE